ncbi:hypothetical protein BPOR_0992g00040 [Botrytis porri]|uniref:Uncharacterized protein n=2 Tax=Botrytis porri TaxID=87229 RepID=A0A4Z1KL03_9HELO|nr:hypothetical protein BPOR_0992g00040 [Botrytis porri]
MAHLTTIRIFEVVKVESHGTMNIVSSTCNSSMVTKLCNDDEISILGIYPSGMITGALGRNVQGKLG